MRALKGFEAPRDVETERRRPKRLKDQSVFNDMSASVAPWRFGRWRENSENAKSVFG